MKYFYIIWDFNGTLIDDVDISIEAVNDILARRSMALTDRKQYKELIDSPIIEYYKKIFDLDKVPFEVLTKEFLEGYNERIDRIKLADGAQEALDKFRDMGLEQCIISSFEQSRLDGITDRLGIRKYFSEVSGADNTRAESKVERGRQWLLRSGASPKNVLVIGDLVHDFELAQDLGADCALISSGHQCREALEKTDALVFDSITEMIRSIFNG